MSEGLSNLADKYVFKEDYRERTKEPSEFLLAEVSASLNEERLV